MTVTEAQLRKRLFRILVRSGSVDVRTAYRRAKELAAFLMRRR